MCALAFFYQCEHDLPTATYAAAWSAAAREQVFAEGVLAESLWDPSSWDQDVDLDEPSQQTYAEAERLATALMAAGCEDPEGAFLGDLARRLSHADWAGVMDITADFACWATELGTPGETIEVFEATASAQALDAYTARGWLEAIAEEAGREMREANLATPDPYADLRRVATRADAAPSFHSDGGIAYLSLIPGARLADRHQIATEDEDLELSLEFDARGHLVGIGFSDPERRVPPELLDGDRRPAVHRGTRTRPGTTLTLAERDDNEIASSHDFSEDVTFECWVSLDIDRAGHLVATDSWNDTASRPRSARARTAHSLAAAFRLVGQFRFCLAAVSVEVTRVHQQ